jgi:AcrR family transcriptional regulator
LEHGYGAATMDLLAAEGRTAKRTLYARFGDKAGVFATVVRRVNDAIVGELIEPLDPAQPARAELYRFALRLLAIALTPEALGVYRLVVGEAQRFPELAIAYYNNAPGRAILALTRYFKAAKKAESTWDETEVAAQFFNAVLGELHRRALLGVAGRIDQDAIARQATSAIRFLELAYPATLEASG